MPTSDSGKAISRRNATTHGLFARDVVLPALGEDPAGYGQLQDEWTRQLTPRNLLEQHYVEKIAAASWRLRRLHRWQAQIFEDEALTELERLDHLDKTLRHETALHRQIDTAVRMLAKDAPQLYRQRLREEIQEDLRISERECRDELETDTLVEMKLFDRLSDLRKTSAHAAEVLTSAPLDAVEDRQTHEICENELSLFDEPPAALIVSPITPAWGGVPSLRNPRRITEYLDPGFSTRPLAPHYCAAGKPRNLPPAKKKRTLEIRKTVETNCLR